VALISARRNVSPRRLLEPGPSSDQLTSLFELVAAAPDHGLLTPWRFVVVPAGERGRLAEAFALALIDRDPGATLEQIEAAREKAHRSPLLILAIVRLTSKSEPEIPDLERVTSLGCAVQNLLLGATAMGFGSGLASGRAVNSTRMRELFGLAENEQAACFVNIGTASSTKPRRQLPSVGSFVSSLPPQRASRSSV
jgi:nitroreductase